MKTIWTLAACLGLASGAWAQDDPDTLRREHEQAMKRLEQKQKAEREQLERGFRERLDQLSKPRRDLEERYRALADQLEKLSQELRKLGDQLGLPARDGARAILERIIEPKRGAFEFKAPAKEFRYKIVPREDGSNDWLELELEGGDEVGKRLGSARARALEALRKIEKRGDE